MSKQRVTTVPQCPCGSGRTLGRCCGPYLAGRKHAPTAEALMRSRYSAYTQQDADYLMRTWHPSTRPEEIDLTGEVLWQFLQVVRTEAGGPKDRNGLVEFVAHYKVQGQPGRLHEVSRFQRRGPRWYYVDGELQQLE